MSTQLEGLLMRELKASSLPSCRFRAPGITSPVTNLCLLAGEQKLFDLQNFSVVSLEQSPLLPPLPAHLWEAAAPWGGSANPPRSNVFLWGHQSVRPPSGALPQ